jgi:hypothetical protein
MAREAELRRGERLVDEMARTAEPEPALAPGGGPGFVLALQRSVGNAAVARALAARHQLIQRRPALWSYQGQTGAYDPAKIRVAAVPDFTLASLTAPRTVDPFVLDPAIKHMTWELYDPADTMAAGFSTLPSASNATTLPFTLQSRQFGTGASFRAGRYLLRLTGLDEHHRPVAVADRDFNVLAGDLTTNTGASTGHGMLTFTKYGATSAATPTGRFTIDVELSFMPDPSRQSNDVVFIQSAQYINAAGESLFRIVNAEQDARKTPLSWGIDRVAGAPSPFYITGRNAAGRVIDEPSWGQAGHGGRTPGPATLSDTPGGSATRGARQMRFESCAISRSGPTAGECYGCATWGAIIDNAGAVTMMPRSVHPMPSEEFEEARQMWNTWRATRPAADRPAAAPAVRSP